MRSKKITFIVIVITVFITIVLSGCNSKNTSKNNIIENSSSSTIINNININKYKYINAIANFNWDLKNGYVYCSDENYNGSDNYTGKVRWKDENESGKIIYAYQVISANGREIYCKKLDIIGDQEKKANNTWDYYAAYKPKIKAKCDKNANIKCYIKLIDENNVEYHVMLTPIEKFNSDEYYGAAIYIIDSNHNIEFWYDDMI